MTASPPPVLPDERLAAGAARLTAQHTGHVSAETVRHLPADSYAQLAAEGAVRRSHHPNAPQLAAALLRLRAGGHVTLSSAGTDPAAEVEPEVAQVLSEAGVSLADAFPKPLDAFPKPLTDELVQAADIVVTVGRGDACPIVPGSRCLDWPVAGPDGAPITAVRAIRDEIGTHITDLLTTLPAT